MTILASVCGAVGSQPDKQAAMTPVKYEQLKQAVLKQRGKVVIVNFWAGY